MLKKREILKIQKELQPQPRGRPVPGVDRRRSLPYKAENRNFDFWEKCFNFSSNKDTVNLKAFMESPTSVSTGKCVKNPHLICLVQKTRPLKL